jgi:hypothetical protein
MRLHDIPPRAVIHLCLQILDQRPIQPDIQALGSVADGQYGFVQVESILQEQFIHGCAGRVRLSALGDWIFAISLWVNIIPAARQQDSLHTGKQPCDTILMFMEGNNDRCGSG